MDPVVKNITVYYDIYECEYGDGFYPYPEETTGLIPINISFQYFLENKQWKHYRTELEHIIFGLDGHGASFLRILNADIFDGNHIINSQNVLLYDSCEESIG